MNGSDYMKLLDDLENVGTSPHYKDSDIAIRRDLQTIAHALRELLDPERQR